MLMIVLDGQGVEQPIIIQSQGVSTDASGTIDADNESQEIVPANADRAGLFFQNKSPTYAMTINDLGDATNAEAFLIKPGETWPPVGYPIPITPINVAGTAGSPFLFRQW